MTISSGSMPLLAQFPFHGILIKTFLKTLFLKSTEFNVDDYAALVAHPTPFWKFPEPFFCLVGMSRYEDTYPRFLNDDGEGGCLLLYIVHPVVFDIVFDYLFVYAEMDLSAFIHIVDSTTVKIVEREHAEGERRLLDSTVGRMVPLLPIAPARAEGDSVVSDGHDAEIELVTEVEDIVVDNVTAERTKCQSKKRPAAAGVSGSSHPLKKLRWDHRTSSGVATGSKSTSALKELLACSILNTEVGVEAMATLPLITSSVSTTRKREGGNPTNSVIGPNLHTIGPSKRFIISPDSSDRSSTNATEVEVDTFIRSAAPLLVMTKAMISTSIASVPFIPFPEAAAKITSQVQHSIFNDSSFAGNMKPNITGPSHLHGKKLLMGSWEINFDCERQADLLKVRMKRLKTEKPSIVDGKLKLLEADRLRIQVSVVEAMESDVFIGDRDASENRKNDLGLRYLNVVVSSLKSQNDGLVDQVHTLEATCSGLRDQVSNYELLKEQIESIFRIVMSSPNHPTFDIEDAFSSNFPEYFPASPGNTSSESLNNSSGLVPIASPTLSLFHNDPYMKVMQAYDAISPPQVTIPPLTVVPPFLVLSLSPMFDSRDFFPPKKIPPPTDTETPVESPIPISPSLSVGSSSPVRLTTPPPNYPFNESIFAELDNSLWIIPRPLGSEPVPEESNESYACLSIHL
ncbi:hypothetical protein Tco_0722610 [Tanacetum coccineum]